MHAYVRGKFPFLGIPAVPFRAAVRPVLKAMRTDSAAYLLGAATALWALSEREYQYSAIELLTLHRKLLHAKDIPVLLTLVGAKSWWDTVDGLAKVIGGVVRRDRADGSALMDRAVLDKDLWVRRVAMTHQLGWRRDTDTDRLFAYAEHLAPEKDFFIRKAIGWALRDYSKYDPAAVRRFLDTHIEQLSPLTAREAGRRLPASLSRYKEAPARAE